MTEFALKRDHEMVSHPCDLELSPFVRIVKELPIFVYLLLDGVVSNVEWDVARATPTVIAGGKVPAPHREVSAEDASFGANKLPARIVRAQSVVFTPIVPCVSQARVSGCETGDKNRLVGVRIAS
jgi:hypothetical protein